MEVKRIGVLTSGGDAPGMNTCIRAVVRTALHNGIECYGIRRGYNGLISGDILRMNEKNISHIINRGGTIPSAARSKEFMTEEGQRRGGHGPQCRLPCYVCGSGSWCHRRAGSGEGV